MVFGAAHNMQTDHQTIRPSDHQTYGPIVQQTERREEGRRRNSSQQVDKAKPSVAS